MEYIELIFLIIMGLYLSFAVSIIAMKLFIEPIQAKNKNKNKIMNETLTTTPILDEKTYESVTLSIKKVEMNIQNIWNIYNELKNELKNDDDIEKSIERCREEIINIENFFEENKY